MTITIDDTTISYNDAADRFTRDGIEYARVAAAPATELGAVFQPKMGERYWSVGDFGDVHPATWDGGMVDRARRAFGNCFRTEADALAYRDRTELVERARRIRDAIWAESGGDPTGAFCYHPILTPSGIGPFGSHGALSPWRFGMAADLTRFIAALGPDAARLLTLEAS